MYVKKIVPEDNAVILGLRSEVMIKRIKVDLLNWNIGKGFFDLSVNIRYRHKPAQARVDVRGGTAEVFFVTPQFTSAPGQIAVFYDGDIIVGGGVIDVLE